MACVTQRLDRSCIIFLCSEPGSAADFGGLTLSTFNGPSGSKFAPDSARLMSHRRRSHRPTKAVNPGTFSGAGRPCWRSACPPAMIGRARTKEFDRHGPPSRNAPRPTSALRSQARPSCARWPITASTISSPIPAPIFRRSSRLTAARNCPTPRCRRRSSSRMRTSRSRWRTAPTRCRASRNASCCTSMSARRTRSTTSSILTATTSRSSSPPAARRSPRRASSAAATATSTGARRCSTRAACCARP